MDNKIRRYKIEGLYYQSIGTPIVIDNSYHWDTLTQIDIDFHNGDTSIIDGNVKMYRVKKKGGDKVDGVILIDSKKFELLKKIHFKNIEEDNARIKLIYSSVFELDIDQLHLEMDKLLKVKNPSQTVLAAITAVQLQIDKIS